MNFKKIFFKRFRKMTSLMDSKEHFVINREFNKNFYLSSYPDVKTSGFEPILHYMEYGWKEGRWPTPDFDTRFYVDTYPQATRTCKNPFYHYLSVGRDKGYKSKNPSVIGANINEFMLKVISKEFDNEYYLQKYPDVAESKIPPVIHFMTYGYQEDRKPSENFCPKHYLTSNPDVAEAGINPFYHYLVQGRIEGRSPIQSNNYVNQEKLAWLINIIREEFDEQFYLNNNPDVSEQGIDPIIHYITYGWREKRNPTPKFDVAFYLNAHPDIVKANIEPFSHYLTKGRSEGRIVSQQENLESVLDTQSALAAYLFDEQYYLNKYPDVTKEGMNAFEHYLNYGWKELRNPSSDFNTDFYLQSNPDIKNANINPLIHYAVSGKREGRLCKHPGGHRADILRTLNSIEETIDHWKSSTVESASPIEEFRNQLVNSLTDSIESKLIISISHDQYLTNIGGIQNCIIEEQGILNDAGYIYLHISPSSPLPVLADKPTHETLSRIILNGIECGHFRTVEITKLLVELVSKIEVIFIIHALHGHSIQWILTLYEALRPQDAFYWLHDYFSICLGYNLLRNNISFCHAPEVNSSGCSLCIFGERRIKHLLRIEELFSKIPFKVLSPSEFTLNLWKEKTHLPYSQANVHEHRTIQHIRQVHRNRVEKEPLRIAFLGIPVPHKGWPLFCDLVRKFHKDKRYRFYHLGILHDNSLLIENKKVSYTHENKNAMEEALLANEIDVVLVLSTCPETFGLTAYEAIAAGAMIVASSESGNVATIAGLKNRGIVFNSDKDLFKLFESNELVELVTLFQGNGISHSKLISSGITAPLICSNKVEKNH